MADLYCDYGDDLKVGANGDYAFADGDVLLRQLVMRALGTNDREVLDDGTVLDAELVMHPQYGAGLGRDVGKAVSPRSGDINRIERRVRRALASVDGVWKVQPQVVQFAVVRGGLRIVVGFVSAATNKPTSIGLVLQ